MQKVLMCLSIIALLYSHATAQERWTGTVVDVNTGEPLFGAVVQTGPGKGTTTDISGRFSLEVSLPATLKFSFTGYKAKSVYLEMVSSAPDTVYLEPELYDLQEVVITSARQEQRREEVVQSVELIRPNLLTNTQATQLSDVMTQLPGVQMQKDQVSIRGVSGFSYGAGSRVMILLDEMPILSADASDIKWNYMPLENLKQIEVIKGASSALYGSSALEGVIHVQTALPADTPVTQFRTFQGLYDVREHSDSNYWGNILPMKTGISLAHRRNVGPLKISSSLYGFRDEGYRINDEDNLVRGNLFIQYKIPKWDKLILSAGVNGMRNEGKDFLFFQKTERPYYPFPNTSTQFVNSRWHSDLSFKFYPSNATRHVLRGRYFNTTNRNNTNQSSTGRSLFTEYQLQRTLLEQGNNRSTFTSGVNYIHSDISSELYGFHKGDNGAIYAQLDQKINKLTLSFGARFEAYKVDTLPTAYFPVFRGGGNIEIAKGSFFRVSAGQGFRYPSVAERFTSTSAGAINIFPNPGINPESGWSAEAGFRQVLLFKSTKIYGDISGFWAEYENMIEFIFGFYPPPNFNPFTMDPFNYLGFKAKNIPQTQVKGLEFSTGINKSVGNFEVFLLGGYTYTVPLDSLSDRDTIERYKYLKYRRQHLARINLDLKYKWIGLGVYSYYNSSIRNMDQFFIDLIEGLKPNDYWVPYSKGFVTDTRVTFSLRQQVDLSIMIKNILNKEYMEVPGNTNAPRTYLIQLSAQL